MDPDYAVPEGAKKGAKERDTREQNNLIQRTKVIIEDQFNKEIKLRETQLEDIQNKLTKVAKTLHVLRYVLIKQCYEREDLILNKGRDDLNIIDAQNRIHPAIKKLFGSTGNINLDNSKRKRLRKNDTIQTVTIKSPANPVKEPIIKKPIKEEFVNKSEISEADVVPIRNRQMIKKRIVVGNISKWSPSDNIEDSSTHKWMVYVRGPKDSPDISNFVQKVVFHLHPSYKPNDVIELKEAPFHLSRRGWGEFPLRVRIFFCNSLNKPVDVIHNLKLDKTHTGQQTLGNETVVELTMYGNKVLEVPLVKPIEETKVSIKEEHMVTNEVTNNEDIILKVSLDHSYALKDEEKKSDLNSNEDYTSLAKRKVCDEADCNGSSPKKIKLENGYLSINQNPTFNNMYKVYFPSSNFKLTVQALPYLLKRLPLISEMASDNDFKCTFPFISKSKEEFESWPFEKKISSEWSRAKFIKDLISNTDIADRNRWTTKEILLYAKAHGFNEVSEMGYSKNKDSEEIDIMGSPPKSNNISNEQIDLEASSQEIEIREMFPVTELKAG